MKNLLFFITLLFSTFVSAQNKIDSLKQLLTLDNPDTTKARIYHKLGKEYYRANGDSCIYYCKLSLEFLKNTNLKKIIASNYNLIGIVKMLRRDNDDAISNFRIAFKIFKEINDKRGESNALSNIGSIYSQQGKFNEAMLLFERSLKLQEYVKNYKTIANTLNNIGIIYYNKSNFNKALEYFQKSLKIKEENSFLKGLSSAYINIGNVFSEIGNNDKAREYYFKSIDILSELPNSNNLMNAYLNIASAYEGDSIWNKAIIFNEKALKVADSYGGSQNGSMILLNLGSIYTKIGNTNKAIEYLKKAISISEKGNNKRITALANIRVAYLYNKYNRFTEALVYAKTGLKLAQEINSLKETMKSFENLYIGNVGLKNYKKALEYRELQAVYQDSIYNIKKIEKINEIQTKYETEKKDLALAKSAMELTAVKQKAKMNKIYLIATALILLFGILMLYFWYRNRITKSKYKVEQFNQKLLRLQMNPHFIFNTLTSIQSYMYEKDTQKAAMYLSSFAKLTRSILDSSREDFISLQEDYENNDNYLKIQKMRYNDSFDYTITIDESIDPENVHIAPMLIQPFVENAVVHGFKNISYQGQLTIAYRKVNNNIEITIEDNGKGVEENKNKNHKSHALSITKERLEILNKNNKSKINFQIINTGNEGYKVKFTVPYKIA